MKPIRLFQLVVMQPRRSIESEHRSPWLPENLSHSLLEPESQSVEKAYALPVLPDWSIGEDSLLRQDEEEDGEEEEEDDDDDQSDEGYSE